MNLTSLMNHSIIPLKNKTETICVQLKNTSKTSLAYSINCIEVYHKLYDHDGGH